MVKKSVNLKKINVLTKDEILEIIGSCATANISHFKYGGLELSFSGNEKTNSSRTENLEPPKPTGAALLVQHEQQDIEYLKEEEARLKEERISMMLIEDPLQAEKLILNGELDLEEGDYSDDE
jgi:hypothetical protein